MKKKILISLSTLLVVFFGALIIIPFFLEAKIGTLLKQNINASIEGRFDFDQAKLSLISSFPKAQLRLDGSHLITQKPFEGDTLFYAGSLELEMAVSALFKGADAPIAVDELRLSDVRVQLRENAEEQVNYNIAKEVSESAGTNHNPSGGFKLALKSYTIEDSEITYLSDTPGLGLNIRLDEHKGSGDLSLKDSQLDTETRGQLSFELDSIAYLSNTPFTLKALIGMDLEKNEYRFLENQALLNQLALVFDGSIQIGEAYQELDIRFEAPSAQFQDFLSIIPEAYLSNLADLKATGDFDISGVIKGRYSEDILPQFGIGIKTEKAKVQYADMPRAIDGISFLADISNNSASGSELNLKVENATFQIGQDGFALDGEIQDFLGEKYTVADVKVTMDLARLGEAYPMPAEMDLSGLLNADLSASFTGRAVEREDYSGIKTNGTLQLEKFVYNSAALAAPIEVSVLKAKLSEDEAVIQEGRGRIGQSDFQVTGFLQHLLGYYLGEQELEGKFNLRSNRFSVADIVSNSDTEAQTKEATDTTALKIPTDLNLEIQATAAKVVYDDLELEDFKGLVLVKNGSIDFREVTTGFFEGSLALAGTVDTQQELPQFALALDMEQLQIQKAFQSMELVQALAPIAEAFNGKFSSQVELSGTLNSDFAPVLSSLSGGVLAEVLTARVQSDRLPVLTELNSSFDFFDPNKLDLSGMKTALAFEDGKVAVKPFSIQYDDISLRVEGGHGFDRSLDYQLTMDVPAKYLGKEVQGLVAKIGQDELKDLKLPVHIGLQGTHTAPRISSDLSSGMKTLTNELVELQKQKLLDEGKEKAQSLIGDLLTKSSDSVSSEKEGDNLKSVLKGIMTKPKDSLAQDSSKKEENPLEKKAQGLLKGLIKGKKKDTSKTGNR